MKKPKLTPWFPADVKPVHVGWYDREWEEFFRSNDYWDGENWFSGGRDNSKSYQPSSINKRWRGLANPPKETKQKGEK